MIEWILVFPKRSHKSNVENHQLIKSYVIPKSVDAKCHKFVEGIGDT